MKKENREELKGLIEQLENKLQELRELTTEMIELNFQRNDEIMDQEERNKMCKVLALWEDIFDYEDEGL